MPGTLYLDFGDMLKGLGDVLKGSGAVEAVERPDQFSGDRLVEDIRRLLEDGRTGSEKG